MAQFITIGELEPDARLISAADTPATVERALESGDEAWGIRHLTEAVSRLIQAPAHADIPNAVLAPPAPISDSRYVTSNGA